MSKNTEIKLVGQPIIKQILNLVDKSLFNGLIKSEKFDNL
jgi:hypothetical protein